MKKDKAERQTLSLFSLWWLKPESLPDTNNALILISISKLLPV